MDSQQYSLFDTLNSLEELSNNFIKPPDEDKEEEEDTEVLHICDGCPYQSENLSEFMSHVEENTPHLQTCQRCDKSFKNASSLKRHLSRSHRTTELLRCESCTFQAISVESLQQHKFASHLDNVYSCVNCGYSYSKKEKFVEHLKSHESLQGLKTGQKIVKKSRRPVQLRKEATEEGTKLVYVDYSSSLPFKCKECEYRSNTRNHLQRHFLRHHSTAFQCSKCPFTGSCTSDIVKHTMQVHGTGKRVTTVAKLDLDNLYVCDICFVVSQSLEEYQKHKTIHRSK